MKKVIAQTKIIRTLYLITIAVFLLIYFWWLRLTPFIFEHILYLILLSIYILLVIIFWFNKNRNIWGAVLFISTIIFFGLNTLLISIYLPWLDITGKCQEITYYISYFSPFGDERWTYYQLTKWNNISNYKTWIFSASGAEQFEIICDNKMKEANFVEVFPFSKKLFYTDGEHARKYEDGTKLGNHQYGLSFTDYRDPIYTILECEIDFTNCHRIPFEYKGEYGDSLGYLQADEEKSELNLYFDVQGTQPEDKLIFTYSAHPRCYVEGCEIK
jgi:hypothetical protein